MVPRRYPLTLYSRAPGLRRWHKPSQCRRRTSSPRSVPAQLRSLGRCMGGGVLAPWISRNPSLSGWRSPPRREPNGQATATRYHPCWSPQFVLRERAVNCQGSHDEISRRRGSEPGFLRCNPLPGLVRRRVRRAYLPAFRPASRFVAVHCGIPFHARTSTLAAIRAASATSTRTLGLLSLPSTHREPRFPWRVC